MPVAQATLTLKFRPRAPGADEGRWYLYIRRPRPARDELIPVPGATTKADRPAVEAFAKPYRKALGQILAEPRPETADEWRDRADAFERECGRTDPTKRTRWNKWISPRIGAKTPAAVTRDDVEDIRDVLDKAVRAGEITGKTAMNVWSALTSSFRAMANSKRRDLRVRADNPCVGVEPPGDRHTRKARRKPFVYPKEAAAVFACKAIPCEWREVHAVAAYTYLRPGELRVLAVGDVDLAAGLISVTKAWDYNDETVKEPKTRNGVRRVPIEPNLAPLLRRMLKGKPADALVVPVLSRTDATTSTNRKASVDHLAALFRDHLRMAGVTRAELHATTKSRVQANFRSWRDSGLTWLAMTGLGVDKISRRAGHDTIQTTMGYVKLAEDLTGALGVPFGPLPDDLTDGPDDSSNGPSGPSEPPVNREPEPSVSACNHSVFQQAIEREKGFETAEEPDIVHDFVHRCEPSRRDETPDGDSGAEGSRAELARLAAKARIVEALSGGDVRVIATELREALEALVGGDGVVIDLTARRDRRA